jgi:O-6-methylguanine DNA methyltransferase
MPSYCGETLFYLRLHPGSNVRIVLVMHYRLFQHSFLLPGDCLAIIGDGQQVTRIALLSHGESVPQDWQRHDSAYADVVAWLESSMNGEAMPGVQPIPPGTAFQQACWRVIAAIPYGQTISYTELAAKAGKQDAVRAAASACGKNPLPLLIPCHRVVGKGGGLGGFAWGLPYKQKLLALENITLPS